MSNIIPFPTSTTLVEIFVGQDEFLVALNRSGVPLDAGSEEYGGTIFWNGTSHEMALIEARELAEEFGGRIVDLTAA
jgi:hypothetical protein